MSSPRASISPSGPAISRIRTSSPGAWRRTAWSFAQRNGVPQSPADLADHNCLTFEYHSGGKSWRFDGPKGAVKVRVSGNLHTNNGEILHAAALGGAGLALLPVWQSGSDIQAGRLKTVLDDCRVGPSGGIYALYPHNRHLAPKVRVFVDFLAARFGPEPYWDAGLQPLENGG